MSDKLQLVASNLIVPLTNTELHNRSHDKLKLVGHW
jgi:hypothetical protein